MSLKSYVLVSIGQVPLVVDLGLVPRNISKVGIVGGGSMASEIATALILADCRVILKEVDENSLKKGTCKVKGRYITAEHSI